MSTVLKPWCVVIWPEDGPRIVEFYDRWLDAYEARPAFEKTHQCKTSIESTGSARVRDLPRPNIVYGKARFGKNWTPNSLYVIEDADELHVNKRLMTNRT